MNTETGSRESYLRALKKRKTRVRFAQIFITAAFLVFWEVRADTGLADAFIVSSPVRIVKTFFNMAREDLFVHVTYTLAETLIGFFLGTAVGFVISVGLWYSSFAGEVSAPFLVVLNSLPKIALGPVIIVWVGAGMGAVVTMALAISLIVTVLELSGGFASTDRDLLMTAESFGAGKRRRFKYIVLPCNVPVFFRSLKVNIGLSLVGVIAGEFLVSKAGLGYLIVYAGQVFRMDLVMMSVVLLGFIAFCMYSLVSLCEKKAVKMINRGG